MSKIILLLAICFVKLCAMDGGTNTSSMPIVGSKTTAVKTKVNYEKLPEKLKKDIERSNKARDEKLEKELEEQKNPDYLPKKLWNAQLEIQRLKTEISNLIQLIHTLENTHQVNTKVNNEQIEELEKRLEFKEKQFIELMNDQGYLLAKERIRCDHEGGLSKDKANVIAQQEEEIRFLRQQVKSLETNIIDPPKDTRTLNLQDLEKLKLSTEIEHLNANTIVLKEQSEFIREDRKKVNQNFWQYIKRPEVVASALSTAVIILPPVIKTMRDMRSNKETFLTQREMLELQKKKLENRKVAIEIANAEDELMKKAMKREQEALKLAAIKNELKASAWLTELAAQEADGKQLTPAQLTKKQRCLELLEKIKTAKQQDNMLLEQTLSPAA